MKMKLIFAIILLAILTISCATSGKAAGDTVSMDKAIADATEELSTKVTDKTEIVIAAIKACGNQKRELQRGKKYLEVHNEKYQHPYAVFDMSYFIKESILNIF